MNEMIETSIGRMFTSKVEQTILKVLLMKEVFRVAIGLQELRLGQSHTRNCMLVHLLKI